MSSVPWCDSAFDNCVPWLNNDYSSSSDDELVMLYTVSNREEWVHPINRKRKKYGELHHLFSDLQQDEERFKTYFRLSKEEFEDVLRLISADIEKKDTNCRKAITPRERLAIGLRFLATGDTFTTISFRYRVGISTVALIVEQVCDAIWNCIQPEFMPPPREAMWRSIEEGFRLRWQFPHCIGVIDGKHIEIQAPPNSGSQYYNYKKYYSVVLIALVDSDYNFIAVDTGSYGKEGDSTIFEESDMGKRMRNYSFDVPPDEPLTNNNVNVPFVIVGDEAFPSKRFIIRPFPRGRGLILEHKVFNYRVCRCRRVVENAFGILAQRWRVFFRPLNCKLETVNKIVKATTVLHNFLCSKGDFLPGVSQEEILETYNKSWRPIRRYGRPTSREATNIRAQFVHYFNSEEGSVDWQWDHV